MLADMNSVCVCGSEKPFDKCCGRFLSGKQDAKTPEQLMRSRYSAYALGGHGEYLMKTWLPAMARNLTALELNQKTLEWVALEVIGKNQKGDEGEVEFRASFINDQGDREVMHELSSFKRINGLWYYVGGVVT
ncbi:MAG: YchJ family protein [Candidatus Pelagadaptatus aseana]|uniref:YchJ family protein n=1 Tax=Candidatus Pelagadaptatus aseana TaxID=3120508 RepID=UPI0039B32672